MHSISAIKAVQKSPRRSLFLVKSNIFCLQFVLIAIFDWEHGFLQQNIAG